MEDFMYKIISFVAYFLLFISSVNYYSMLQSTDELRYVWITLFVLGIFMQMYVNQKLFRRTATKLVYLDILLVLWVIWVPGIVLPYGLSRLLMITVGMIYALIMARKKQALMN